MLPGALGALALPSLTHTVYYYWQLTMQVAQKKPDQCNSKPMPPVSKRALVVTLLAVAFLATCMAVTTKWAAARGATDRERFDSLLAEHFSSDPAPIEMSVAPIEMSVKPSSGGARVSMSGASDPNIALSQLGNDLIDGACQVTASDGSAFSMHRFPHLDKHPSLADACVLRTYDGDEGIMDADLSLCTANSFLFDPAVVKDVVISTVNDRSRCVVEFVPGLDVSAYDSYQRAARTGAIKHTKKYIALKKVYDALMIEYLALVAEVNRLKKVLQDLTDTYNRLVAELAQLKLAYQTAVNDYNTAVSTLSGLKNSIASESAAADGLERSLVGMDSRVAAAKQAASAAADAAAAMASSSAGADKAGQGCAAAKQEYDDVRAQIEQLEQQIRDKVAQMAGMGIAVPNAVCADINGNFTDETGGAGKIVIDLHSGRGVISLPVGGSFSMNSTAYDTFAIPGMGLTGVFNKDSNAISWSGGSTWTKR